MRPAANVPIISMARGESQRDQTIGPAIAAEEQNSGIVPSRADRVGSRAYEDRKETPSTSPGVELVSTCASPPITERGIVPAGSSSLAGYTAMTRRTVLVEDVRMERRFEAIPTPTMYATGIPERGRSQGQQGG